MTEQALPLITFYKGWETYQHYLVETIAPLSSEQLALPAASHHWTIGMLAQHMVANRVWWFQVWMGEGSPDLAPIAHWDEEEQPALDAAELVAGLEATWRMIAEALARWTPADLGHVFPIPGSTTRSGDYLFSRSAVLASPFAGDINKQGFSKVAVYVPSAPEKARTQRLLRNRSAKRCS